MRPMSRADPPFHRARRAGGGPFSRQSGDARRTTLALAALALAGLAALALLARYGGGGGQGRPELDSYEPRELVPGTGEPVAPRVVPELEQLERSGLEAAAAYAGGAAAAPLLVRRHDSL